MKGLFQDRSPVRWLLRILLLLVGMCFTFMLFKNISHPLFWNDEGMTVMHSRRVLEYGYPKAWDGKNNVYDLMHDDKKLGLDKKTGAFIGGSGWGHYYFLAPVIALTDGIKDVYLKTGLIRSWFALAGLAGLLLFCRMIFRLFERRRNALSACLIFAVATTLSIPLVLHLRDARYYSLVILLTAFISGIYIRQRWLQPLKTWKFGSLMFPLLIAMLITFSPGYFALVGAIGLMEILIAAPKVLILSGGSIQLSKKKVRPTILEMIFRNLPILVSLLFLVPFFIFFNTFEINRKLLAHNVEVQLYAHYLGNLRIVFDYLIQFEPVWLLLSLKFLQLVFFSRLRQLHSSDVQKTRLKVSVFLTLIVVSFIFFASRVPNYPFTRYFLPVIPLLGVIIVLDFFSLWKVIQEVAKGKMKFLKHGFAGICLSLFVIRLPHNAPYISGHVYEMFHPYKGHLDHMIPWIIEKYPHPEDLVIAANYEETSFMYYLNARVTVGYVQANLSKDTQVQPDIIYFNPLWMWGSDETLLKSYLSKATYEKVYFPVAKYRVNNIPEVHHQPEITHQFRTLVPHGDADRAELLVRTK